MKLRWLAPILAVTSFLGSVRAQQHRFSVVDSIEMTTFSDPPRDSQNTPLKASPDGRYCIVVTTRGFIKTNEVKSTIWLFAYADVRNALKSSKSAVPKAIASAQAVPEMHTTDSYEPVISNVRWSTDSRSIYYFGQYAKGQHRLFRVYIETGRVKELTPLGLDVETYAVRGNLVAFLATSKSQIRTVDPREQGSRKGVSIAITGIPLMDIL